MVAVDVHVGHAPDTLVQQVLDRHGAVVVDAESAGLLRVGVVHPAPEVHGVHRVPRENGHGALVGAAHEPGARLVHPRVPGGVLGAETALGDLHGGVGADGPDRVHVVLRVDEVEHLVRGHLGRLHRDVVPAVQAELLDQPVGGLEPYGSSLPAGLRRGGLGRLELVRHRLLVLVGVVDHAPGRDVAQRVMGQHRGVQGQ